MYCACCDAFFIILHVFTAVCRNKIVHSFKILDKTKLLRFCVTVNVYL